MLYPLWLATATPTEINALATLEPMDFNTPQAEDIGPVSPVWLEGENTTSGRTFPAYLSGLSFRDDSVWLVDQNGVGKMVMGQPAAGQLSPDGTSLIAVSIADQAALFGLLNQVRELGTPLLSLTFLEHDDGLLDHTEDRK